MAGKLEDLFEKGKEKAVISASFRRNGLAPSFHNFQHAYWKLDVSSGADIATGGKYRFRYL